MNDIGIGLVVNMLILDLILSCNEKNRNLNDEVIENRLQRIQCGITDNLPGFSTEEQLQKTAYIQF